MSKREPDWAAVAQAYARGEESERRIAIRFGIPSSTLYYRAKREGWVRPKRAIATAPRGMLTVASLPKAERPPPPTRVRAVRRAPLLDRLFRSVKEKMTQIEAEDARARDEGRSPAEGERSARTLAALGRLYDKLTEVDVRTRKAAGPERKDIIDDDAERLRQELAERFDRLRRSHADPGLPREP